MNNNPGLISRVGLEIIKEHEGFRQYPYKCSANKTTIGYGHNLDDRGISKKIAEMIFKEDINVAIDDVFEIFPDFHKFTENQKIVLVDMMFNLGIIRFRKFRKMIRAIKKGDWKKAIIEMRNSRWYSQVTNRVEDLIDLLEEDLQETES